MMYLDTHAVLWLYTKQKEKFSVKGLHLLEFEELFISPMVQLELEFLYEIKRITVESKTIIDYLSEKLNLSICRKDFTRITAKALDQRWTRDPFDRIICAQAALDNSLLLTKDKTITEHYEYAVW